MKKIYLIIFIFIVFNNAITMSSLKLKKPEYLNPLVKKPSKIGDTSNIKDKKTLSDWFKKKSKMNFEENLKKNKYYLPKLADPVGSYVATKEIGKLLYISGQISIDSNGNLIKGKLGKDLTTEQGYEAAKRCALSITAQAKKHLSDDLSRIKSCIKLTGFVNSTDNFTEQPKVINGASETIVKIFGDSGMHTRAAVSTNSLPLGVAVEVDAIFEIN